MEAEAALTAKEKEMPEATPTAEHIARRRLFTAALRSGEFAQGHRALTRIIGDDEQEHCCLGVACIIAIRNGLDLPFQVIGDLRQYSVTGNPDDTNYDNSGVLPDTAARWYGWLDVDPEIPVVREDEHGVAEEFEYPAAEVNDSMGKDFAYIADAFDNKYVLPYEAPGDPSGVLEP